MEGGSDEDDDLEVRDKVANLMTKRKRNNDDRQDERRVRSISIWTETSGPACWWSEAPCSNICNENYETKIDTRLSMWWRTFFEFPLYGGVFVSVTLYRRPCREKTRVSRKWR